MFCKNCGNKIEENSKPCSNCQSVNESKNKSDKGLFSVLFNGRIGRLRYLLYIIIFSISTAMPLGFIKASLGNETYLIALLIMVIAQFLFIPIVVKRLHDIGLSGYFAIPICIIGMINSLVYISVALGLILLFKGGDIGENKYGQPKENGKITPWIVGSILFLLFILILLLIISPLFR